MPVRLIELESYYLIYKYFHSNIAATTLPHIHHETNLKYAEPHY